MLGSNWKKITHRLTTPALLLFVLGVSVYDAVVANNAFIELPKMVFKMLLASNNQGHMVTIILLWLLPIYYLLLHGDWYIREVKRGVKLVEETRTTVKKYHRTNIFLPTMIMVGIYALGIIVNAGVVPLINEVDLGADASYKVLEVFGESWGMSQWLTAHLTVTYILYSLMTLIVIGMLGIFISCVLAVYPSRQIAYPVIIVYWLLWWYGKFNLANCMQPFTEFGLSYAIVSLCLFVLMTGFLSVGLWRKVIRDDVF